MRKKDIAVDKIYLDAKNAFIRTKISGFRWVINQYAGCCIGCKYCYARFVNRFYGQENWGTWVVIKRNLPTLVKDKYVSGKVLMSSISDPYQPIESRHLLTRRILEHMDKRLNLTILTKSSLVLRDIDILMKFSNLEVGLTLNSWDEELRGCLEPYATPIKGRIRALEKLHDSGIDTYAFISPVLPGITDVGWIMENIKDIIKYVWIEMINLRLCGKEFKKWFIQENSEACSILHKQVSLFNYISRLRREISRYPIKLKGIIVHPLYEKRSFTIE